MHRSIKAAALVLIAGISGGCGRTVGQTSESAADSNAVTEATTVMQTTIPPAAEPVAEPPLSEAEKLLQDLTLHERVCQMFMVTPEQLTSYSVVTYVDDEVRGGFEELPVGGIVLFAKNLETTDQTRQLLADFQSLSRTGLFTAVDEEGGTIARAAQRLGTTSFYGMRYYGDLGDYDTAVGIGRTIGADIGGLGFNVDFAPVADVDISCANELGSRIFSSDPYVVASMASGVVSGLHESGVCATLKHFPGLGAEDGNTHYDSSVTLYRSLDELRETELIPFAEGIESGADFVMVGHQTVTGLGDGLPCDLSYAAVTELLRGELGFEGLVITDSQQMNTISRVYNSGEAAVMSIQAGVDIVLMPQDIGAAVEAVEEAVQNGDIAQKRIDESVLRILEKKHELAS